MGAGAKSAPFLIQLPARLLFVRSARSLFRPFSRPLACRPISLRLFCAPAEPAIEPFGRRAGRPSFLSPRPSVAGARGKPTSERASERVGEQSARPKLLSVRALARPSGTRWPLAGRPATRALGWMANLHNCVAKSGADFLASAKMIANKLRAAAAAKVPRGRARAAARLIRCLCEQSGAEAEQSGGHMRAGAAARNRSLGVINSRTCLSPAPSRRTLSFLIGCQTGACGRPAGGSLIGGLREQVAEGPNPARRRAELARGGCASLELKGGCRPIVLGLPARTCFDSAGGGGALGWWPVGGGAARSACRSDQIHWLQAKPVRRRKTFSTFSLWRPSAP